MFYILAISPTGEEYIYPSISAFRADYPDLFGIKAPIGRYHTYKRWKFTRQPKPKKRLTRPSHYD